MGWTRVLRRFLRESRDPLLALTTEPRNLTERTTEKSRRCWRPAGQPDRPPIGGIRPRSQPRTNNDHGRAPCGLRALRGSVVSLDASEARRAGCCPEARRRPTRCAPVACSAGDLLSGYQLDDIPTDAGLAAWLCLHRCESPNRAGQCQRSQGVATCVRPQSGTIGWARSTGWRTTSIQFAVRPTRCGSIRPARPEGAA